MKKVLIALGVGLIIASFVSSVMAADMPVPRKKVSPQPAQKKAPSKVKPAVSKRAYKNGPIQKLERGTVNMVFGWSEIPKKMVVETKKSNPLIGLTAGLFKGCLKAFARTASGISEVATFPVGGYDKPGVKADMDVK